MQESLKKLIQTVRRQTTSLLFLWTPVCGFKPYTLCNPFCEPLLDHTRGGKLFSTSSLRRRRQKGRSSSPALSSCARSTLPAHRG